MQVIGTTLAIDQTPTLQPIELRMTHSMEHAHEGSKLSDRPALDLAKGEAQAELLGSAPTRWSVLLLHCICPLQHIAARASALVCPELA